ncbi:COBRA-like protein 6 [Impatiens glandulifera]|uniref:COBRA-like protein 6 n=1 Tax=Impatiens glandulifera TaxID=253017 RepID=UPI001FB0F8CF|nr:COBRA-like protein 6 [Impatiens glandulifera]
MDLHFLILFSLSLIDFLSPAYGYDPLDPNGNITIKWDVLVKNEDGNQNIQVSILNYQLYRHIELPGWRLSWGWQNQEVIWDMSGSEATEQGNCSTFLGSKKPHCCLQNPVIVDLLPGTPFNKQVSNCCKGGVLPSFVQGPGKFGSSFLMTIGSGAPSSTPPKGNVKVGVGIPTNFSLGVPGYSCGEAHLVPPSKFYSDNGRRTTEAVATYNVTCSYSQFLSSPSPKCCVSLSAFYNESIIPCPRCSCGCQGQAGLKCVKSGETPPVLQMPTDDNTPPPDPLVVCTRHMCPIRVHWHVKVSYKEYWRVKMTITNMNYVKNYSEWNLEVLHPSLQGLTQVFSFNYKPLNQHGNFNDTGMFYGIKFYNDMLSQAGENGNVQTEILLRKDPGNFTFRDGWAFPRRIYFNGDECVMPAPDDYPMMPSRALLLSPPNYILLFFLLCILWFSGFFY